MYQVPVTRPVAHRQDPAFSALPDAPVVEPRPASRLSRAARASLAAALYRLARAVEPSQARPVRRVRHV